MWSFSRVDFLPSEAVCIFCNRPLRSEKGIVVTDGSTEQYSGPNCARKWVGRPEVRLLDVTRLALLVVSELNAPTNEEPILPDSPAPAGPRPGRPPIRPAVKNLDDVTLYLRLRYELMSEFRFHRYAPLTVAYEELQSLGAVSDASRIYVTNTIRNARHLNTIFSLDNIKHAIGLDHWLKVAVAATEPGRRQFLESMTSPLHHNWRLSVKQLEVVNKWGEKLRHDVHSFPHLDAGLFEQVTLPRFMQSKK